MDASAAGLISIPDERSDLDTGALEHLFATTLIVPSHWRLEVANMLRTAVRRERLGAAERMIVLSQLARLPIETDGETWNAAWSTTLDLSDRFDLTPYDAAYLELALRREAPLATLDRALVRAARAAGAAIVELP